VDVASGITLGDIQDENLSALAFAEISKARGVAVPAQYGYDSFGDAVAILQGEDPGVRLRGVKTRSFYNNMLALDGDTDVTADIQMLSAARGSQITVASDGAAEIVRNVTTQWNGRSDNPWGQLEPRQIQAIIWSEWKLQQGTLDDL
jgi:hypothetical protein